MITRSPPQSEMESRTLGAKPNRVVGGRDAGDHRGVVDRDTELQNALQNDVAILRARAVSRNMSLTSYLRELIHDSTSRPEMGDVLARIASREQVEAESSDIRSFILNDRTYARATGSTGVIETWP